MFLTDTHTHLYSEAFDEDRTLEIQKAIDAGIQQFFLPAIDSTYYSGMKAFNDGFASYSCQRKCRGGTLGGAK